MNREKSEQTPDTRPLEDLSPKEDAALKGGKSGATQHDFYKVTLNDVMMTGSQPIKIEDSN